MPITKSYVKEGTFRSGVFRRCLQNNPCKSQQGIKKYIFKYEMDNFVRLDYVSWQITRGCPAEEPGELWGAFGAFCLYHTFIFMQPSVLPNSLSKCQETYLHKTRMEVSVRQKSQDKGRDALLFWQNGRSLKLNMMLEIT